MALLKGVASTYLGYVRQYRFARTKSLAKCCCDWLYWVHTPDVALRRAIDELALIVIDHMRLWLRKN